ncbi:hypothetical protein [Curtobacterium sp. MCBA15_004]|uniref:hypothetical protein n=1 Tax=unclassified Curtobacterium TaxID=257496 RepID=UPI0008DE3281|nr:hypothetical protein [Curtobacterium sp. MCBA15_004]WIA98387.1 hypothetical protein QOL16_08385 [Curtobacterium sp. MCBA15_004]
MRRPIITVTTALAAVAVLSGCTTDTSGPVPDRTTARPTASATPTPTTSAPSGTQTSGPAPEGGAAPAPGTSAGQPAGSALAQHVFDECSRGAPEAGVRLSFTEHPTGYRDDDGRYQVIYPFTFLDGHEDPWAVYNCTLTDDSVTSEYVASGLSDAH